MKSIQSPHQSLTEEEIKEFISSVTVELHYLNESLKYNMEQLITEFSERYSLIEVKIERLKRHFCPEKFQIIEGFLEKFGASHGKFNIDPKRPFTNMKVPEVNNET